MRGQLQFVASLVLLVVGTGCAVTQSFAKRMVNTQPKVALKTKDYESPAKIVGGSAERYVPALAAPVANGDLLARYAPIIVQGVEAAGVATYPADSDRLGQVQLRPEGEGFAAVIDTQNPVLYSSMESVNVHGIQLTQLVYVFWLPRHPVGMVEKGDIDGGVLRITLDSQLRPAVFEYVMACGCWHGVFVAEHVEAWAQQEFKNAKETGKSFCVEKTVENSDDWKVRDLVRGDGRPVVFVSAGKHQCVAIQTEAAVPGLETLPAKSYGMHDYSELDHVTVVGGAPGQTAAMFNPDGLVWGGRRKGEEKMFSKLDHGGWPRRLNAMKIHWDQEAFNDASLLDKFMRMPAKLTGDTVSSLPASIR
jgi:hypothetical protein